MSLKSRSSKLYLGIGGLALAMWMLGVSGGTILTVVLIAFMLTMHLGGHGGHGGHGGSTTAADTGEGNPHTEHEDRANGQVQVEAPPRRTSHQDAPRKPNSGCH